MQVFHTAGVPPSIGRSILPIIGWTRNSSVALTNRVSANRSSSGRAANRKGHLRGWRAGRGIRPAGAGGGRRVVCPLKHRRGPNAKKSCPVRGKGRPGGGRVRKNPAELPRERSISGAGTEKRPVKWGVHAPECPPWQEGTRIPARRPSARVHPIFFPGPDP